MEEFFLSTFFTNDKFSANLIKRVADKHKNFVKVVNEIMGTELTLDEMLEKYNIVLNR